MDSTFEEKTKEKAGSSGDPLAKWILILALVVIGTLLAVEWQTLQRPLKVKKPAKTR